MKLSTYFRHVCKDNVRFYKGNLKTFAAKLLLNEFFYGEIDKQNLFAPKENQAIQKFWRYEKILIEFIKTGKILHWKFLRDDDFYYKDVLIKLNRRFQAEDFPKFDIVCVNSLFTFFLMKQ